MSPAQFQNVALDILRNYWRIQAAAALYTQFPEIAEDPLEYTDMPAVGVVKDLLTTEPGEQAMSALQDFALNRLPRDFLLALIAEFESRLVARLSALGNPGGGTLGNLQHRIQRRVTVNPLLVEDLDEIRERRNTLIHNENAADADYVTACAKVLSRSAPFINATAVGDDVSPTAAYLTYAADVFVRYSNAIG